jgi:ATP-dependent RNA helicase SUPV3L1/SUV3
MRELEDRLSDTLHERLMQRFIDRRTSALMRGLRIRDEVLAGVAADGAVTVEGHYVGRLRGVRFDPAQGSSALEDRALRAAAQRAVAPEVARRLGRLAADEDGAFALQPDGMVLWGGEAAGQLSGGTPFAARVRLFGELGPEPARERAARRLEAFVAAEAGRRLAPLRRLESAVTEGRLKGLARGLAYRLIEAGGVLDRRPLEPDLHALSQAERRALRALGVRIGAFSVYLPGLLTERARSFAMAFVPPGASGWSPPFDRPSPLPSPAPPAAALSARGLRAVGDLVLPVDALERLDALLRGAPRQGAGVSLSEQAVEELGWSMAEASQVMRGLGFVPMGPKEQAAPLAWRLARRGRERPAPPGKAPAHSPFAALAALKAAPPRRRRRPRKKARA